MQIFTELSQAYVKSYWQKHFQKEFLRRHDIQITFHIYILNQVIYYSYSHPNISLPLVMSVILQKCVFYSKSLLLHFR